MATVHFLLPWFYKEPVMTDYSPSVTGNSITPENRQNYLTDVFGSSKPRLIYEDTLRVMFLLVCHNTRWFSLDVDINRDQVKRPARIRDHDTHTSI